jgi:tetratricopeptide (TPR) repeat protein
MTRGRYWLFMAITVLTPFLLLGVLEVTLRIVWKDGAVPVFVATPADLGDYTMANPKLATRYFSAQSTPPSPMLQPFATQKPANGFRVFVMGASTAAGFPWPPTGAYSRLLQDVLHDAMPGDSVEVVNLAIPATNTYAILDQTDAVIAQHPDAILIYSGQNEYYGALGVGSTESVGSWPPLVRSYLWLEHFRTFMLLRRGIARARKAFSKAPPANAQQAASFMEVVAGNQKIVLGGPAYEAGVRQFRGNLTRILDKFRRAHVPVFISSLVTNERDMRPFASPANALPGGADAVYDSAQAADARGDSVRARELYVKARDLDVVRFRAPSEFNDVIRSVAKNEGAVYVPVAEAFHAASPEGIIGHNLILEHLHPNQAGAALIAHEFWTSMDSSASVGHKMHADSVKPWASYVAGMDLTPFDYRMVAHTVKTLSLRWPFVPVAQNVDYRGTYHPTDPVDSLAFVASAGVPWVQAKTELGQFYEKRGFPDSAVAEYKGLIRDLPEVTPPYEFAARALLQAGDTAQAVRYLDDAYAIHQSPYAAYTLGMIAENAKDYQHAVDYLTRAAALEPMNAEIWYQLSVAHTYMHDIQGARAAAIQVARIQPNFPGLAGWLRVIGVK